MDMERLQKMVEMYVTPGLYIITYTHHTMYLGIYQIYGESIR